MDLTSSISFCLFAQEHELVRQSHLAWMFQSLGLFYGLLIPAAGLAVFVGACLVVALNRRPAVIASFLVILPLPLLIGIFGSITGFLNMFQVLSIGGSTPKSSDFALGISAGLFTIFIGFLVNCPSYFVVAIGLFVRTIQAGKNKPY